MVGKSQLDDLLAERDKIGQHLKAKQRVLWWVLPQVYGKGLSALLVFLLCWFGFPEKVQSIF